MLPPIDQTIQRCRALAALDLILSPDWEYRYYSFNSRWAPGKLMASMRNGSGDEWWMVFHHNGWAALKGLGHESKAWSRHQKKLSLALHQAFPNELKEFTAEPAFCWDATSFAFFRTADAGQWTRVNDLTQYSRDNSGEVELLEHVCGDAADYVAFGRDYFEKEIDALVVEGIFALRTITPEIVASLNPTVSLEDISTELYEEIQYPR